MVKKSKSTVSRFIEYSIGGTLYFWIGYGLFAVAFSVFGWNWFWAKVIGDVIGRTVNYVIQRYWAFSDTHKSEARHISRYTIISVASVVLDYAIVGGLTALGVSPYVGQLASAGFFTIWNYLWYKYWVFPGGNRR